MTARVRRSLQLRSPLQLLAVVVSLLFAGPFFNSFALDAREYAVEISVDVLSSPFALRLNWQPTSIARTYTIRRRPFGATDWGGAIATLPGTATQYTDTAVSSGNAYEYEVQLETTVRNSGWVYAYGYVLAGGNVAWPDLKGKVILIVDDVAAGSLNNEIAAYQRELLAAGWFPIRRDLTRTTSVPEVKNIIRAEYNADPANVRSVILLGNVPVPYSGNIAPDLHESHRGAWPADVYYAEMNGNWTDNSVNVISGDYAANNNTPGDGKFDQSQIPTSVELEIGRIDFANMSAFSGRSEVDLLRNYLKKNNDYRRRVFTATPRMLVRDNFGDLSGDAPAVDAWRHYRQMFGPGAVREVGPNGFFSTLQNESFLWAYGGGGGGLTKADTIGTTWDFAAQNPRAVFLILHGSYFGDWNTRDNFLRAAIGSQSYTLASIWSGLPHWFMHPMGLGRSIGHSTRISQNNISDYQNYQNFVAQQVHIALIGDPTLENYPVIPPSNLSGSAAGATVNLNWSASSDQNVVGYFVYHSASANGPFQRITPSHLGNTSHAHAIGSGTHHYMVRAVKLERTGSGTFYNFSQGIFTSVTKSSGGSLPEITISADDASASETGLDSGTLKIMRNVADSSPLTVDLVIAGTAQNGTDYQLVAGSAQIPAGSTTESISIAPRSDNLIEGEETVTIEIKASSAYTLGAAKSALVRIADAPNEPPVASPQNLQSVENTTVAITLNGQDPENQPLTYRIVSQPTNGTVAGTPPNLIYQPATNYFGADAFSFVVNDGNRDSATATVTISVAMGNRPPLATGALLETLEDIPIQITLFASDPNNDALQYEIVQQTTNGVLSGSSNVFEYLPGTNFFGEDSFTFRVRDGQFTSEPAVVSLNVVATNDPPVATNVVFNISEDGRVSFTLNAFDAETNALTFTSLALPVYGTLIGEAPNLIYTPYPNFYGADELKYVVSDALTTSVVASVTFIVHPANDTPLASSNSLKIWEDHFLPITLQASDIDADPLTFEIIEPPKHGTLFGLGPDLYYLANTNYFGDDSFKFVARDGKSVSESATVQIEIIGVDDWPIIVPLEDQTIRKNVTLGPLPFTVTDADNPLSELLIWFTSENEEVVSWQNITVLPGNEQFVLTPRTNATGETTITMNVNDGYALVKISFQLTITNTPPLPHDDSFEGEAGTVSIALADLLYNDTDADGDTLKIVGVSSSETGRSVQLTTNAIIYLGSSEPGEDLFSYEVEDTSGSRSSATVRLSLTKQPKIQNISRFGEDVRVDLVGPPHREFWLLSSVDGTEWDQVQTGLTDNVGHAQIIHNGGGTSEHHRFYRVIWP